MKTRFLKFKNWLLLSVMGGLGLASCHSRQLAAPDPQPEPSPRPREEMRLMYGVPSMGFRISGRVSDPDGRPVKDIQVRMLERGMQFDPQGDTLVGDPERVEHWMNVTHMATTDADGRFLYSQGGRATDEVRLLISDPDAQANGGHFRTSVVSIPADGHFDRAEGPQGTIKADIDVRLQRK